ncbi:MAG: PQQ-binding-like beta-propeller repeat protein, partial [Candidatus Poribacteria bacterium]|nr:PQQ-binding-like beta-propeller repeat protein [Candidatus Poribacteria bacterium]
MKLHYQLTLLITLFGVAVLLAGCGGAKAEWPQYQGLTRDNISHETGWQKNWAEDGPQVLWRIPIGEGYSGISIVDGRIYTMLSEGEDEFAVCLDASDGTEIWRSRTDEKFHSGEGSGPRSTPAVDGDRVYVLSAKGKLYGLDAGSGEKVWGHDFVTEFESGMPGFGFSSSPIIEGDALLIEAGGKNGKSIVAFDKKTGAVLWTSHTDRAGYSSPIVIDSNGVRQAIFMTGSSLVSVSPTDGTVYWSHVPWPTGNDINAAVPIYLPGDRIFVSAAYDKGSVLVQMKSDGDEMSVEEVWRSHDVMENWMSSSVLLGEYLYGFDEAILKCIEANTGEQKWALRGFGRGTLLISDGHLIILGEGGNLRIDEASPSEYIGV